MKLTVKNASSYGIVDKDNYPYCMKVEFKPGDEWEVSEGYCPIEGTKCCEKDGFMIRLPEKEIKKVFDDLEEKEGCVTENSKDVETNGESILTLFPETKYKRVEGGVFIYHAIGLTMFKIFFPQEWWDMPYKAVSSVNEIRDFDEYMKSVMGESE